MTSVSSAKRKPRHYVHPDGRRVTLSFHHTSDTFRIGTLRVVPFINTLTYFGATRRALETIRARIEREPVEKRELERILGQMGVPAFVVQDWKGLVRGPQRHHSQWIGAAEAGRVIGTRRAAALVRSGELKGIFVKRRRGPHTECWIQRESLDQWMIKRAAQASCYMPRREAGQALGLTRTSVLRVAKAGLIRYVKGLEPHFPHAIYLHREDVMKIKYAFEKRGVPDKRDALRSEELMALRRAIWYLGRDSGLPAIRAVVDGTLVPVAHSKQFPGITGYFFLLRQLRKYRPALQAKARTEDFLCYKEAASKLGTCPEVIRKLAARRVLGIPTECPHGQSKLLPAADVERFGRQYVPVSLLAKRFGTSSKWLAGYLEGRDSSQVLAVRLGTSRKLFVPRQIASRLRIPHLTRGR